MTIQTSPQSLAFPPQCERGGGKIKQAPLSIQWVRVGWLAVVMALLLVQFWLRIEKPGAMAGFIDEYRHISRAQAAYEFKENPIEFSHGKLLLYYWLGLFSPKDSGALITSRLAIALVSLLTSASIASITRLLYGRRAVIPALLFYLMVPHAVFYERLALADPLAGALAAVTTWQCVILIRRPTRRRGTLVGLLIAATTMAKLTTALILVLPVFGVILLATLRPRHRTTSSIKAWSSALGRRYMPVLNMVRTINMLLWLIIGAAAYLLYHEGEKPIIVDTGLLGFKIQSADTFISRFSTLYEIVQLFTSSGMALILLVLTVLLLIRRTRPTLFILMWLLLLTAPSVLISWKVDARYLIIGQPALAVLFGSGIMVAGDELARSLTPFPVIRARRSIITALPAAVVLGFWSVAFALPFDWNVMVDPADLTVPPVTSYIFFAGPVNAWGTREAITYLEKHADPGPIPTVAVLHTIPQARDFCDLFDLYQDNRLLWTCRVIVDEDNIPYDARQWPTWAANAPHQSTVYVITDLLSQPPDDSWQLIYNSQRPQGGRTISLWRVTIADQDKN